MIHRPGLSFFSIFLILIALLFPVFTNAILCSAPEEERGSRASEEKTLERQSKKVLLPVELKEEIKISAEKVSKSSENEYLFEGFVDIVSGTSRIQADKVYLDNKTKNCLAEGSVLLDWGENRLAGDKLEFNLDTKKGVIYSVLGYIEPEYLFSAEKVEKIADDKIVIRKGVFTSCTQPTPYWSFRVGRALVHLDHYAHLRNVLFKVRKIPLIYLPYLIWPVKEDRAAGFLFPEVGSTKNRGRVISEAFFWPIRRNMDVTFYADYYTLAGLAGGIEYNFLPNDQGKGRFLGYYIDDKVADRNRYNFNYTQEQNFPKGYRLTADVNEISDFNYFIDFERDLKLSAMNYSLSRINLARNWSYYSTNFRAERREQLLGGGELVQSILPRIEFRGRSQRLWNSLFYFSFESSFNNFAKEITRLDPLLGEVKSYDADYMRFDLFPTISAPYSPFPWLDLNPSIHFRETYYTRRLDPEDSSRVVSESLNRFLAGGTLEIIGPKFYRIYERPKSEFSPLYKHSMEPRIVYSYSPTFDRDMEVPRFDEIDFARGGNIATLFLRNALYAKRSPSPAAVPSEPEDVKKPAENVVDDTELKIESEDEGEDKKKKENFTQKRVALQALNPVEIASFEIFQSYSFDFPLSSSGASQNFETKNSSPISAVLRLNPAANYSFDLKATYDTIYKALRSSSISASLKKGEIGFLSLNLFRLKGFEGTQDHEQLTFEGGTQLFHQKLGLNVKLSYNLFESFLPEQRYRIEYFTQCCGFYFEYLKRDFTTNERREFRFAIDLKGIGKVIDFHHGFPK
ncbi:MAG: LPS assembly protein LptD [Acidobacteriota bacterium]